MISAASTVMFWYMAAIFDILQKENRIQGTPIIKLIVRTFTYPLSNYKQQAESKTYTKYPLSFPQEYTEKKPFSRQQRLLRKQQDAS